MAQPLFRRLRGRHPALQLYVLAPSWTAPLLRRMPEVSDIVANPFAHGELQLGLRRRLGRQLSQRGYHQAIVLPNSFKSALVPWFASVPLRTGYVGELRYVLLNDARRLDERALPLMAERYAALAEAPGRRLPQPLPALELTVSESSRAALLERLELDRNKPVAVLCPGAEYGPAKRWPAEYFAALAIKLAGDGHQVWIVGSSKDQAIGDQIARASGGAARDLCGRTNLEEAVDLLSCARVVVSNDSGLMHVAAALAVPLIALYGSSSPTFTPPLSRQARVLKLDLPCSPCYKRQCPLGHFHCMVQLAPERVHSAVVDAMSADRTRVDAEIGASAAKVRS